MKKYNHCLIIGKFMPPHKGHEYMIRFAQEYAQNVTVVVDCLKAQTISPEKRKQWLEEQIKGIEVKTLKSFMPQDPSETPDFWSIWKKNLLEVLNNGKPDVVVAAMDYGQQLAKVMECDFIPIDIARESFPVSATMLRDNVFENWDFLMDSAKPDYIKKVCLLGPESTGKSTAGKMLSHYFNTTYVPEYAKAIIDRQKGNFFKHNVEEVALAQINTEKALAKFTNKIMICDSSPLTTLVYSELLFNYRPQFLEELIIKNKYDLTLLFSPDTPFVQDTHRNVLNNPDEQRKEIFLKFKKELSYFGISYEVIEGSYEQRDEQLVHLLNNQLPSSHKKVQP